jgi:hypothetical protein
MLGAVLFLSLTSSVVGAQEGQADFRANSEIIRRVQEVLPKYGFGELHIDGGAALSLAMGARHGTPFKWHDLDIRAVSKKGPVKQEIVDRIVKELGKDGWAKPLPPGTFALNTHDPKNPRALHEQGLGVRMVTRDGLRFDLPFMHTRSEVPLGGFNSAESLVVPLKPGDTLNRIVARLKQGSARDVVKRGDVSQPNGNAEDVIARNRIRLTNRYLLPVQPELSALRFLRGIEKLQNFGVGKVDASRDMRFLKKNLPRLIRKAPRNKDPAYKFLVQEQAQALLKSGGPDLLRAARSMGLNVQALAQGRIQRRSFKSRRHGRHSFKRRAHRR